MMLRCAAAEELHVDQTSLIIRALSSLVLNLGFVVAFARDNRDNNCRKL